MKVDITFDNLFLIITSDYQFELNIVKREFTREIPAAWIVKKQNSYINTERTFINNYGMIPIGLWLYLIKVCKRNNFYLEMSLKLKDYFNLFTLMSKDDFLAYIDDTFEGAEGIDEKTGEKYPFHPYGYQLNAAYDLLRYKKCCGEISTSSGKTLISFMIFKWLIDKKDIKKILYIVPNVDLASQSAEKYEAYESYLKKHHHNWNIGILKSGLTKKQKAKVESCNILFGTYQSLCKKSSDFFSQFNACIIDEAHHTANNSIKNILNKCVNLEYSIAMTGTFPKDDTYESMVIQSYVGPVVYNLTANELINEEKTATPIYIVFQIMNWASEGEKSQLYLLRHLKSLPEYKEDFKFGGKLLKQEQKFVNDSYTRMKYIGDMAIKMKNNCLVLFGDIKGGYGKKLYEYIKSNSDKNVYYIDGGTPSDNREFYKQQCEEDLTGKTILVASIGTFGEGIDIKNIWSIFLVNTAKSENKVRQICGRGLRKFKGKDKTVLFDFVDDLRYTMDGTYRDNYMWKHYKERQKIYKEQNFPIYEQKINFS